MDHQWAVRSARRAYNEQQHSWARISGSARRNKMSDSKQGFKVCLGFFGQMYERV